MFEKMEQNVSKAPAVSVELISKPGDFSQLQKKKSFVKFCQDSCVFMITITQVRHDVRVLK